MSQSVLTPLGHLLIIVVDNLIQVVEVIERSMTGQGIGDTLLDIAKLIPERYDRMGDDAAVDVLPVPVGQSGLS